MNMKVDEMSGAPIAGDLPLDILHLIKHCGEAFFGNKSSTAREVFEKNIHRVHRQYSTSNNPVIVAALLACWTPYIKYIAIDVLVPKYHAPAMNYIVDMLAKNKLALELATRDTEGQCLVALLCMTRVHVAGNTRGHPPSNNVNTLLRHWSGQPVEAETIYSLEKTVDTLYGPACWSLYRDDVASAAFMPRHLYKLGLPVTGMRNALHCADQVTIPVDFN